MKKTIFSAVFTISLFTALDRFLGFVFKIFLSRQLGAEKLGVYQVALSFFFVLLTATTSGIPLIVSKLTAKYRIENDLRRERALTTAALIVGLVISVVIVGLVLILKNLFGLLFTDDDSFTTLLFLLPALVFSSVYSAFRGNLWGRQRYFAVALVEVIEQIVRIITCVILFYLGFNKLHMTALSLSIGCFVSMSAVSAFFFFAKGRLCSPKGEIKPLLISSTPITVSRAASSIVSSLLAIAVPFLLIASNYTHSDAMALFGASMGMALPILYIPITVVGSLAFVMIPTVSTGISKGERKSVNAQMESSIAFSILLASFFIPMFASLGQEIGVFLYGSQASGKFLRCSAWLLLPLSVENITSSLMNSLDLEVRSFVNYLIGALLTFGICFAFYGNFTIEILAFALGLGWSLSTVLHIFSIRKKTGMGFSFFPKLIKSVVLVLPSTLFTRCIFSLTTSLGSFLSIMLGSLAGMAFFSVGALFFGLVDFKFFGLSGRKKSKNVATHRKSLAK